MSVQPGQLGAATKQSAKERLNEIQNLFEKQVEVITYLQEQLAAAEKVVFSCLSEKRKLTELLES